MGFRKLRKIQLPYGMQTKMASHFGVSVQTINSALTNVTDSDIAAAIRNVALENYGGKDIVRNKYFK